LNSSFKARTGSSSDLTLAIAAGGGGGPCLVMRDLRISKNYWASCTITAYEDDSLGRGVWQGVGGQRSVEVASRGSSGGVREQVHFGAWLEGICMSMTALTNSWASLKVTKRLDGERFGLLGGAVRCAKAKGVWTISVGTSVAEDFSSHLNKLLAKFCLHFVRCILTEYLRAWRLRISSAASTLLR